MVQTSTISVKPSWTGGRKPFKASYGKLMMWFFLMSDAFTFGTFLVMYGAIRFSSSVDWADPEAVFTHFPILHEWFHIDAPLAFVGLMTFILIASSVTMVLAVEAGHRMDKKAVEKYMLWTIIGGAMFLGCQAYEWYHFILGTHYGNIAGSIHLMDGTIAQFMSDTTAQIMNGTYAGTLLSLGDGGTVSISAASGFSDAVLPTSEVLNNFLLPGGIIENGVFNGAHESIVSGASLTSNQYCQNESFAGFFFFITGFHGSHVASGVFINFLIYRQVQNGVMEKRGHYEMVEKVGLYWHFVDLVWVFVFTFFYLV